MYNQEIKERFLEEYLLKRNAKSCLAKLEAISSYEEFLNKDCCQMSFSEIIEAIKIIKSGTYQSAFSLVSLIRSYVRWCLDNAVLSDINRKLLEISIDDIDISDSMRNLLFRSEHELITELRSVRSFDDGYYDVIVTLLSWIGLSQDKILNLKISDVDFEKMCVTADGGFVAPISEDVASVLRIYSKTKIATREGKYGPREVYRDDSYDRFVRKFSARTQLGNKLTKPQLQSALHDLNVLYAERKGISRFTSNNVIFSGGLHRVWELERSGVDVMSMKNKKAVLAAYRADDKLHEILWLYKNYKKAFSL